MMNKFELKKIEARISELEVRMTNAEKYSNELRSWIIEQRASISGGSYDDVDETQQGKLELLDELESFLSKNRK